MIKQLVLNPRGLVRPQTVLSPDLPKQTSPVLPAVCWDAVRSYSNFTVTPDGITVYRPGGDGSFASAFVNTSKTSGYLEITIVNAGGGNYFLGLCNNTLPANDWVGDAATDVGYWANAGTFKNNSSTVATVATATTGDVIGIAFKGGAVYFSKNGTWLNSADPSAGTGGTTPASTLTNAYPAISSTGSDARFTANFGQAAFNYTIPSGLTSWDGTQSGASGVNGTLAKTLANLTLSSNGQLKIAGTLVKTLGNVTLASNGQLKINGTLAKTLANLTLSSNGQLKINGTLAKTLANVTLSSTGQVIIKGSLAKTLGNVTLSSNGTIALHGSLAKVLGSVAASSTGQVLLKASLNKTLGLLTGTETGHLLINGSLNNLLGSLAGSIIGQHSRIGQLALALGPVSLAATTRVVKPIRIQTGIRRNTLDQILKLKSPKAKITTITRRI